MTRLNGANGLLASMGYPRGRAEDGRTTWGPHGQDPNLNYLTQLHTKLRQKGFDIHKKRDYWFTTDQIEAVKELITDFFKHVPLIEARGPNRKTRARTPTFRIFVKSMFGKTLTLDVTATTTVLELKAKVQDKGGGVREEHYLKRLGGDKLEDSRTLSDYNVQPSDTLVEMGRLRGGGPKMQPPDPDEDNIESIETQSN